MFHAYAHIHTPRSLAHSLTHYSYSLIYTHVRDVRSLYGIGATFTLRNLTTMSEKKPVHSKLQRKTMGTTH